mgnify:CR=1 FL=1
MSALLGLTLGESRLAALVASGLSPRDAAHKLNITTESARTILKRVFQKTNISRQNQLAARLGRLVVRELTDGSAGRVHPRRVVDSRRASRTGPAGGFPMGVMRTAGLAWALVCGVAAGAAAAAAATALGHPIPEWGWLLLNAAGLGAIRDAIGN